MTGKDTLRDFCGIIVTLVTGLQTSFNVVFLDERALFRELPNAVKKTFLQLEVIPPYATGPLHDLCVEVIYLHERREASMVTKVKSVNFLRDYLTSKDEKFTDTCNYCDKSGHRKS